MKSHKTKTMIVSIGLLCIFGLTLTGCTGEPLFEKPLIAGDYAVETSTVTCKVISTSTSIHEETKYSGGYGMIIDGAGNIGYGYTTNGSSKTIEVVDYSMVVEDTNGKQLCLESTEGLYNLYKKGDTIDIQQETRYYAGGMYNDDWTEVLLSCEGNNLDVLAIKSSSTWDVAEEVSNEKTPVETDHSAADHSEANHSGERKDSFREAK